MRRLLTMLAATALLAGGAGALPAQAAPDPGMGLPTSAGSTDPAGDAEGRTAAGRAAADLRGVEYHAPFAPDGEMRFRLKFAKLHNGSKAGAPRQRAAVTLIRSGPKNFRVWVVEANNFNGEVTVRSQHKGEVTRITPETSKVRRTFKRGGAIVVTVSSEWLPVKRALVRGYGLSGEAIDDALRIRMDVSGESGTVAEPTPPAPAREAKRYANCDALQRDWRNGVAQGPKAARKQVRDGNSRPASGKRARAVYQTNKGPLDRDKDGTACEN